MTELGYALSSEEHRPNDLVRYARRAEEAGFSFAFISDHYHPWIDRQGQSSFVWSVIGAIAHTTQRLRLATGVTCPIMRIHPGIIAQAAATCAAMMPGRFMLGVGSGENLNEHIVGQHWPPADTRLEMLEEAVEIIRLLWQGGQRDYEGSYFTVENARLYTLPDQPPPIVMAAGGPTSGELAGRIADGLVATTPDKQVLQEFDEAGGSDKPRYGQVTVCYARDEREARRIAYEWWPTAAVRGELQQELPLPRHFEQAAQMVREEDVAKVVACGPDPQKHLQQIKQFTDAGFQHVYIHQVGPDQDGFFQFYEKEIMPKL